MSAPLWEKKKKKSNIEWGLLWNLLACASVAGPEHLIDEKTAGDLMPLPVLPDTKNYPHVSASSKIWPQIETMGGTKYICYPWTSPKFIFGGGNTICRMLALQKEIGVGRGWQMKMNGTVWSLGGGGGGGLCVELIPQLLVPSARCDVANTSTDKFI